MFEQFQYLKYHNVWTVPIDNRKIVERGKIDTHITHKYIVQLNEEVAHPPLYLWKYGMFWYLIAVIKVFYLYLNVFSNHQFLDSKFLVKKIIVISSGFFISKIAVVKNI